jgi:uncharacterized zinc-type alcohol dehydrogenase-like protein
MENLLTVNSNGKLEVKGYGASGSLIGGKTLKPMTVEHNKPEADEVLIEVLYCGVCHSDVHQVNNDWANTIYPCVPGHEIIGRVAQAGAASGFTEGQIVGVGCMINSCQECSSCKNGDEQFCLGPVGMTMTYNGYWKPDGTGYNTFGGYSTHIVANKNFVINIPENLDITAAAPILCAGVTTYSPLKHANIKAGDKVGVVGIGGLGHMGVMIAKAMGAKVVAITTKEEKRADALALGADEVIISTDKEAMEAHQTTFNFILVTIPEAFDVNPLIPLLGIRGAIVTVGLLGPYDKPTNNMEVAKYSTSVGGSLIGSVAETQEVIDFCSQHGILPQVEMIDMEDINNAFEKIVDEEVRYRYVIDMKSFKEA